MLSHFYFRGHPGAQRAQREASQDTSMASDVCNFSTEVTPSMMGPSQTASHSHRLLTPSSQDYHRYCIPVIQSPDLRAQCIFLERYPSASSNSRRAFFDSASRNAFAMAVSLSPKYLKMTSCGRFTRTSISSWFAR